VRSGQGRDPPLPRRLINWGAWQAASERTPAHAPIHLVTISPPRHSLQQPPPDPPRRKPAAPP